MYVANGDKEKRWDKAMEVAQEISDAISDFKWEVEPPRLDEENSDGEIRLRTSASFVLRKELKEKLVKLLSLSDELEIRNHVLWILRWKDVYSWQDNIDDEIIIYEEDDYEEE